MNRTDTFERLACLSVAFAAAIVTVLIMQLESSVSIARNALSSEKMVQGIVTRPPTLTGLEEQPLDEALLESNIDLPYLRPVALRSTLKPVNLLVEAADVEADVYLPIAFLEGGETGGSPISVDEGPSPASADDSTPEQREATERSEAAENPLARFEWGTEYYGLATYYHPSLAGWRMANGRPYNRWAMTAASNRWPLGTELMVLHGGKSVVLEITDRGNFRHALDLSEGAFLALAGSTAPGVLKVRILEPSDGEEG